MPANNHVIMQEVLGQVGDERAWVRRRGAEGDWLPLEDKQTKRCTLSPSQKMGKPQSPGKGEVLSPQDPGQGPWMLGGEARPKVRTSCPWWRDKKALGPCVLHQLKQRSAAIKGEAETHPLTLNLPQTARQSVTTSAGRNRAHVKAHLQGRASVTQKKD